VAFGEQSERRAAAGKAGAANVARPKRRSIGWRRVADAPSRLTHSCSGMSAAPALPAAARRPPCPPGGSLAVCPPTRDAVSGRSVIQLRLRDRALVVRLVPDGCDYTATVDGAPHRVVRVAGTSTEAAGVTVDELTLEIDGRPCCAVVARARARVLVALAGQVYEFETGEATGRAHEGAGSGTVTAPMPGKIVAVLVEPGQAVEVGAPVVVLEAMKMESTLAAEVAGRVDAVRVAPGALVAAGDVLVEIAPRDA